MKKIRIFIAMSLGLLTTMASFSQPGAEIEVKNKPDKYENRKLGAEKTGEKKFTLPRRIIQNTVTHYNYYFNANNRLNEIVERAKAANKDDYSQLLNFYNYSLDVTSADSSELDSVIYKCTAGILLHDLRNDWIDNMYLLMGKAFFYRKDWDSAALTFQYINYAYAPKEDGGYDIPIGSNSTESGEFSIATKESKNFFKKLLKRPPSRNVSFLWQVRNFIERDALPEAAGLIEILRSDPNFPKRLDSELHEMLAYWFYSREVYDSSAYHLSKALDVAENNREKARWEYLIAQMYQLSGDYDNASKYYSRSIKHTSDPVMDVYARLNSIRVNRGDKKDYLQKNIDALVKMAKRDKYANYRDIIYFAAANIELERNNTDNAQKFLLESVKYTANNPNQRTQSFLLLGDLNYDRQNYYNAHRFYDSTELALVKLEKDKEKLEFRKPPLKTIAEDYLVITEQDSLQRLANMPVDKRDALVRQIARQIRKEKGLKEEDSGGGSSNPAVQNKAAADLFADNSKSADFYFYNAGLKAKGFSEFKAQWGQRPNVDNWRRKEAINQQAQLPSDPDAIANPKDTKAAADSISDFSFEGLLSRLPLDAERLAVSNKSLSDALFSMGKTLFNQLEEYDAAIKTFEDLLSRFPDTEYKEEVYFYLVYAYQKVGNQQKSDYYKNLLQKGPADNKWSQQISNAPVVENEKTKAGTKKYADIYNLFIEGKFNQALAEKKVADSLYGNSFWTPQLMYIEAIYYVQQKEDSAAIKVLTDLSTLHAKSPMAEKAKTMVDVLQRRTEIENYLTNLEVKPVEKNKTNNTNLPPVVSSQKPTTDPNTKKAVDSVSKQPTALPQATNPLKKDSTIVAPTAASQFSFNPAEEHYVVVLMDAVDDVYVSEGRNAFNRYNREKFYNQQINISTLKIDDRFKLVLQGPFADAKAAVDYVDNVRPVAGGRILPWLSAEKYSFLIISNNNLETLKQNKNVAGYKQVLKQVYPDKF